MFMLVARVQTGRGITLTAVVHWLTVDTMEAERIGAREMAHQAVVPQIFVVVALP